MTAPVEHFQLDEWEQIRVNVEREFWHIQRRRLPILELCQAPAPPPARQDGATYVALVSHFGHFRMDKAGSDCR